MARRDYYFKNQAELDAAMGKVIPALKAAIEQRNQMAPENLKQVLDDRNKRFYRAKLIYKLGVYGYHMPGLGDQIAFKKQFGYMQEIAPAWEAYLKNIEAGVLRKHFVKKYDVAEELELLVETWIWWAEFTMEIQREGEEERWTIESLELASKLIDEGYLKLQNGVVRVAKIPPMNGWERVMKAKR